MCGSRRRHVQATTSTKITFLGMCGHVQACACSCAGMCVLACAACAGCAVRQNGLRKPPHGKSMPPLPPLICQVGVARTPFGSPGLDFRSPGTPFGISRASFWSPGAPFGISGAPFFTFGAPFWTYRPYFGRPGANQTNPEEPHGVCISPLWAHRHVQHVRCSCAGMCGEGCAACVGAGVEMCRQPPQPKSLF